MGIGRAPGVVDDDGTRLDPELGREELCGPEVVFEEDDGRVPPVCGLEVEGAGRLLGLGAGRGRGDAAGWGRGLGEGRGAARGLGFGDGFGVDFGLEVEDADTRAGCTRFTEVPGRSEASAGAPATKTTHNRDVHILSPRPKTDLPRSLTGRVLQYSIFSP